MLPFRHGDFFTAVLKAQPQFLNDWKAKLWSRFFCLSVYITMYLNDHQRSAFYESLGLDTRQFNQHVIIETNKSTARVFPQVRPAAAGLSGLELAKGLRPRSLHSLLQGPSMCRVPHLRAASLHPCPRRCQTARTPTSSPA